MTKPISPDQIAEAKTKFIPDFVFEAFNRLIALNFTNGQSRVYQSEAVDLILDLANSPVNLCNATALLSREVVFSMGWLNVEEAYREAGWKVEYTKPYNEDYKAFFEFSK